MPPKTPKTPSQELKRREQEMYAFAERAVLRLRLQAAPGTAG